MLFLKNEKDSKPLNLYVLPVPDYRETEMGVDIYYIKAMKIVVLNSHLKAIN